MGFERQLLYIIIEDVHDVFIYTINSTWITRFCAQVPILVGGYKFMLNTFTECKQYIQLIVYAFDLGLISLTNKN